MNVVKGAERGTDRSNKPRDFMQGSNTNRVSGKYKALRKW